VERKRGKSTARNKKRNKTVLQQNIAVPPYEVFHAARNKGFSKKDVLSWGWYAIPTKHLSSRRIPLQGLRRVSMSQQLAHLNDQQKLTGSIYWFDFMNGCYNFCPTCATDARWPSAMIPQKSVEKFFSDKTLMNFVHKDEVWIGYMSDILNHPQAIGIIRSMLQAVDQKHTAPQKTGNRKSSRQVKVFTLYKKEAEPQLDDMIALAMNNEKRLFLTLALPLCKTTHPHDHFKKYAAKHSAIFEGRFEYDSDYVITFPDYTTNIPNIFVKDILHVRSLLMRGRVLSRVYLDGRVALENRCDETGIENFLHRGRLVLSINPEGLWASVFTTGYESHTSMAFTLVTPENLPVFSALPWHNHFSTPPFWQSPEPLYHGDLPVHRIEDEYKPLRQPRDRAQKRRRRAQKNKTPRNPSIVF
jgi:hypothetical protein